MINSCRLMRLAGPALRMTSRSLTTVRREEGVATITLSNPKTRNALSLEMMKTLMENLSSAASDKTVRSIVVRGEGKVFCSGHSLKELTSETSYEEHLAIFTTCEELMLMVGQVSVPVVAVVTGHAAAAGCQLVASCDLVIATPSAQFSTPGASVGTQGGVRLMPRR